MPTAEEEVQALLRFLTQEAKLPLSLAVRTAKTFQEAKLTNAEQIAASDLKRLEGVVQSTKDAKKIWNSAKRYVKKRPADDGSSVEGPAVKKSRKSERLESLAESEKWTPSNFEAALSLSTLTDIDEMSRTTVVTNRAPLVLAMAFVVTKYTMPEQPVSSRLSLAQAVVSANSRTRAGNLGLVTGPSAEEEGWGKGQPTVKVLGREISVLKRYGYEWKEGEGEGKPEDEKKKGSKKQEDIPANATEDGTEPALWGLDLEAWRNTNRDNSRDHCLIASTLPIHRPESARDYLMKSFAFQSSQHPGTVTTAEGKKKAAKRPPNSERCLRLVLGALDELCRSWASTLDRDELDRRAWSWYVRIRPEVQDGVSGWGQKGEVRLADVLELKKNEDT